MRISDLSDPYDQSKHGKATIAVEMDLLGDETVALFTLNFDPSVLSNPVVTLAEGMPEGITLTANTRNAADGRVAILLDSGTAFPIASGARVVVTFDIARDAPGGDTSITFDGTLSMSDAEGRSLDAAYSDGRVTIKAGRPRT